MNDSHSLPRSTITGAFLGVFGAIWLQRFSQVVFESASSRPWADDIPLVVAKWVFVFAFLIIVLSVIALMWRFATLATQRETILQLGISGTPVANEGIVLLRNFKHTIAIFFVIAVCVIALPFASLAFFSTLNLWEVTIGAVILPLLLGLFLIWPEE